MTVVLQHQFWDLEVTEIDFEVGVAFGGIPERLAVPFSAIKGFFDPSVQFGLQFQQDAGAEESSQPQEDTAAGSESTRAAPEQKAVAPAVTAIPVVANTVPKQTQEAEPENTANG